MENAIPNYISALLHMLPSLSLSDSLALPCLFAAACRRSHCCPRPQDERSRAASFISFAYAHPATAGAAISSDLSSCSRFYLFVFIIQQNQLRLHPVTSTHSPSPSQSRPDMAAVPQRQKLVASPHELPTTSSRLLLPLTAMLRRDVYIYGLLFPCPCPDSR